MFYLTNALANIHVSPGQEKYLSSVLDFVAASFRGSSEKVGIPVSHLHRIVYNQASRLKNH